MIWRWVVLTFVSLVCLLGVVEEPRAQQCHTVCKRKDYRNRLLLESKVCTDDYTRSELDGEHVSCTRAQEEVDLGILRCTIRKWWQEGEPVALYHRVLGSSYMIYALLMPTIIFLIYQLFAYFGEQRRENKWFSERHSFVQSLLQLQQNNDTNTPPTYSVPFYKEYPYRTPRHTKRLTNREMREMQHY